jgi:hypothetical protein
VAVDMSLLRRRRDLRLMTIGYTVSLLGSEFTQVALAVQVYALTHSTLAVGLMLAIAGGRPADPLAYDSRS